MAMLDPHPFSMQQGSRSAVHRSLRKMSIVLKKVAKCLG
jgi:hypothetical protein